MRQIISETREQEILATMTPARKAKRAEFARKMAASMFKLPTAEKENDDGI
jgi:ribosomal protein S21